MTHYVLGFRFDPKKKKVVLIQKNKPDWQKGKLNGVGGKIELYDNYQDVGPDVAAMVREFKEETGVQTEHKEWSLCAEMSNTKWHVFVFKSVGDISKVKTVESEKVLVKNIDDLPKNTLFNLRWLIPLLLDDEVVKPVIIQYPTTHE